MLDREKVLSLTKPRERVIDVPTLGEQIKIRLFTKQQLEALYAESTVAGEIKNEQVEKQMILRGCLDPAFTDADFEELRQGNAAVYYGLLNAVMEGNGLTALAQRAARRTFSA